MVMMPPNVRPPGPPGPPPGRPLGPGGPGGGPDPTMLAALKMAMPMIERIAATLSPEDVQRIMANGGMPGGPGPMRGRPPGGMPMGRPPIGPGGPGAPGGPMRRPIPRGARPRPPVRGRPAAPARRPAPRVAPRRVARRR